LQEGIAQRKERAIALLEQAVRSLEEELPAVDSVTGQEFELPPAAVQPKNAVFVVHGHDEAALQAVARFLEQLGLQPIVLREQPDSGRTIIEKFEDYADQVGFAVVLLTPDDIAGTADAPGSALRARQNVIFELGYSRVSLVADEPAYSGRVRWRYRPIYTALSIRILI
jgi:predicted nucleotide-binding protein